MSDILKEALADAKKLEEAAVERAKNMLVEAMRPKVGKMVKEIMDDDELPEVKEPTEDELEMPEEAKDVEIDLEEPSAEEPAEEEEVPKDIKTEAKDKDEEKDVCEVSNLELSAALQELEEGLEIPKNFGDPHETDQKTSETPWDEEEPVAAEKTEFAFGEDSIGAQVNEWTVNDAKKLLKGHMQLRKEVKSLKEQLKKRTRQAVQLAESLKNISLTNARLAYFQKLTNSIPNLTENNKFYILEQLDKAKSISDVKLVYNTLQGVLAKKSLQESRRIRRAASEVVTKPKGGEPKADLQENSTLDRMKKLAGLKPLY